MKTNLNISTKISLLMLLLSVGAVSAMGFFVFGYIKKTNQEKFITNLKVITENKAGKAGAYFTEIISSVHSIQKASTPAADPILLNEFIKKQNENPFIEEFLITTPTGEIKASAQGQKGNFLDPDGSSFSAGQKGIYFSDIIRGSAYVTAPLKWGNENLLLIAKVRLDPVFEGLNDRNGLGQTGEITLAQLNPGTGKISFLKADGTLSDPHESDHIRKAFDSKEVLLGKSEVLGIEKLEAIRRIEATDFAILTSIHADEAEGETAAMVIPLFFAALIIVGLTFLLALLFSRSITQPLYTIRQKLGLVSKGMLPENSTIHTKDEFGEMSSAVDQVVHTLKENAAFAKRIGEGKYDTEFSPASENDVLGMSLISMRKNLIETDRRDNERNWIVSGVAEFSKILRIHDTIDKLGDDVLAFIIQKIEAIQGAFYAVHDDETGEKVIDMRASNAYGRKKHLKAKFRFSEGLVGQAASEKDTILRTEIPDDYLTITSGILGDQRPTCILIVPLITNEEVYGVLEFAGFKKFDHIKVKFVEELSVILSRTIFNIRVNERTWMLLEDSQKMSNELKEKQEVLRQNAESMRATQEELLLSNQKLEEQIEEVNRTQNRTQLLLENASEVITIYEEDGTIRYISPSVETILGYGQKELIGKKDLEHLHRDYRGLYEVFFIQLASTPDEKLTMQYEYKTKDGRFIWIESTGSNFLSNRAIRGIILNSRDITEKRRAEQEQRMRSKMQSLSENSPDLITRIEDGTISYINPVIEAYTGKTPDSFLNKKVRETEMETQLLENWLRIVEEVNNTSSKVTTELEFPSLFGKRVMQVNAIPEFDELKTLESVLLVAHDITERKLIEMEIHAKNKKITESINYAKRIQNAILPNMRLINRSLPDSFVLYKPKDVVSGDFPWFVRIKDEIFIAAVDCTGHGVPGALLSLIGYFLLNDIVRSRRITEPGKILDLLDEGVTMTLRQDEDATTKDGMDIALCRINLANREIEYAGAHRSLYMMRNGVMEEIKGNKFPIGGGIFKNQTNFTNTKVNLSTGDSIYFCSDGFPDQFGGPEGRKFGPKKMREIIERVHTMPMKDALQVFDQAWETWRGEQKQTDDVLLIGIKV